jgi:hypothetical protein
MFFMARAAPMLPGCEEDILRSKTLKRVYAKLMAAYNWRSQALLQDSDARAADALLEVREESCRGGGSCEAQATGSAEDFALGPASRKRWN